MENTDTIEHLHIIKNTIYKYKTDILHALYTDLHKSAEEALLTEYVPVIQEISLCLKKAKKWNKPRRIWSPLLFLGCSSYINYEPYGNVLIISPWNYPFQLSILPAIGAIAAGNTVIIKPSELAKHTSNLLSAIAKEANISTFNVVTGEYTVLEDLIPKSNYLFFTGSTKIGRIIYEKAAKYLIPVTLELGGKSPVIIEKEYNVKKAAEKILWGKLLNAGQTCVAPDHVYLPKGKKDEFISHCIEYIEKYGKKTGKIINEHHYSRLETLLRNENIVYQEKIEEFHKKNIYFPFTIVINPSENSPIMQEEIFGPILPIIEYDSEATLYKKLKEKQKVLALYIFRNDTKNFSTYGLSSGGLCFNATLLHLIDQKLPFGGVGESGIGQYHGIHSLETFSRKKAIFQGNALSIAFIRKAQQFLIRYF
ncbi:MAG: aldehyde dehydrogenase family protein [Desulfovibrionaceae bacterium]